MEHILKNAIINTDTSDSIICNIKQQSNVSIGCAVIEAVIELANILIKYIFIIVHLLKSEL